MTNLTDMEKKTLYFWECNYDSAEAEKEDNCTPMEAKDISRKTGYTVNQSKGIAGSLIKKGLVEIIEGNDGPDCFWLTDEGVDARYSLREAA